jgi:hypothetical protein
LSALASVFHSCRLVLAACSLLLCSYLILTVRNTAQGLSSYGLQYHIRKPEPHHLPQSRTAASGDHFSNTTADPATDRAPRVPYRRVGVAECWGWGGWCGVGGVLVTDSLVRAQPPPNPARPTRIQPRARAPCHGPFPPSPGQTSPANSHDRRGRNGPAIQG